MKRLIFLVFCLVFGFSTATLHSVKAVETVGVNEVTTDNGIMPEATPSPVVSSEYIMPYPGMTPDHPLFIFKKLRDQIMDLLISDPVKKAEFAILKSDKYLGMSVILKEKARWDLVESTVKESNANFVNAVSILNRLNTGSTTRMPELKNNLTNSGIKHLQIIRLLSDGATEEQKMALSAGFEELQSQLVQIPQ